MRDARNIAEIARLQPDYMGFIFYRLSPRFAGGLVAETLAVLSPATKKVGVFADAPEKYVRQTAERYGLDYIQLHGDEAPPICASLRRDFGVIKAFAVAELSDLAVTADYEQSCDFYLFDTKTDGYGGSGRKFDHRILANYLGKTPYLLGGGLSADYVPPACVLADKRCVGLDINSRFESAPGVKDPALVKTFIETIKTNIR